MKKFIGILMISFICCSAYSQDSTMQDTAISGMGSGKFMKNDCVFKKDGKIMVMKHGSKMMLDSAMTLKNGAMIMTDGTVKMTDGSTKMLKEGQYVDMNGKMGMIKDKMKKKDDM